MCQVETGMTVDKVTFITTRQHLRRQEEPYFRLTPSQLSELLSEYEQVRTKNALACLPLRLPAVVGGAIPLPRYIPTHVTTNTIN